MIEVSEIQALVQEYLDNEEDKGFFLVHTQVHGANEILVEIDHDSLPIDIDTIAGISRWMEDRMDRDKEDFELTISSAGLTSPLRMPRQYKKYVGEEMIVVLKNGMKEQGTLTEANEDEFTLEVTRMVKQEGDRRKKAVKEALKIHYSDVKSAVYDLKV